MDEGVASSGCGCGCFRVFGFGSNRKGEYEQVREEEESWMVRKLKKMKEVSEVVGGPKWKNFIRRMGLGFLKGRREQRNRFQYDAESYALNFDDDDDDVDDDSHPIGFSSRFALPLSSDEQH